MTLLSPIFWLQRSARKEFGETNKKGTGLKSKQIVVSTFDVGYQENLRACVSHLVQFVLDRGAGVENSIVCEMNRDQLILR
jgi:hypothetical protein